MAARIDTTACCDPDITRQSCEQQELPIDWWGKPNQFQVPLGRGPGFGWVLLVDFDLSALDLTKDHDLTFEDDQGNKRTLKKITVLRGRDLTPGAPENDNSVFLCDVVDRRFHLARIPCSRETYNIRSASGLAYLTQSLNTGVAWTWQQVVQDLCTTLGLGTQTLPFTPDGTPEDLTFFGGFAWSALNDVLDRIACTVKYDAEADTFKLIRLGDVNAAGAVAGNQMSNDLANKGQLVWNSYWNEPARGKLPEKIRVTFFRRPQPTDGSSILYHVDVTLAATTGVVAGSYVILHDDLVAIGLGTPTNAAACSTRATERANDWLRKLLYADARRDVSYRDFQKGMVFICETNGTVIYDDRGGAMRTAITSVPDDSLEDFRPYEQPLVLMDSDATFLAVLTAVDYTTTPFIKYTALKVDADVTTNPVTYSDQDPPVTITPLYHMQNKKIPVRIDTAGTPLTGSFPLSTVRCWPGPVNGSGQQTYFFCDPPWEDLVRDTGTSDGGGEIVKEWYFNQNTFTWVDGFEARMVDPI